MPARTTSRRGTFTAKVLVNRALCREHFLLRLGLARFPATRAGQFVQLQCRGLRDQVSARAIDIRPGAWPRLTQPELADKEPMLRRPFSLAARRDRRGGVVELDIIYRTIGTGTSWLTTVRAGDRLSLLGPLGNGFEIAADRPQAALIGGGVGIPPLMYLAEALAKAGKKVVAFCGARSAELVPLHVEATKVSAVGKPSQCVAEFNRLGVDSVIATDDASLGFGGMVSEAFRAWLNAHLPPEGDLVVYSCGPEPMMRAVAEMCLSRGYGCLLALERHMACGMGTCQSCVVKIRDASSGGWSFKLCCTDGPVFDAKDVLW